MLHYEYEIKKDKNQQFFSVKPAFAKEPEQLLGMVDGKNASDIEERFANALEKYKLEYYFRVPFGGKYLPGWRELDFLVINIAYYPVQIDDISFIHKGTQSEDMLEDALIMEYLKDYSPQPMIHVTNERLGSQESADFVVKELFL